MCGGGGDDGSAEARRREMERQTKIRTGMMMIDRIFQPYNDDFFNKRRDAYVAYASPQLEQEASDAGLRLSAALSRSGALQSSEAIKRNARLRRDHQIQRQAMVDRGTAMGNEGRRDIENARSSVVADLYATADPAAAAQASVARAKIASQDPSFDPIGRLFQDITTGLADWQESRAYSRGYMSTAPGATGGRDSGRNVRG